MNKKAIIIYIVALILSLCFICGVALAQEPVEKQSETIEDDNVETQKEEIVNEIIEVDEEIVTDNFEQFYQEYQVPSNRGFKSYMSYKAITSKSSSQYELQNLYVYTGEFGIRQVDGRFCVAIGTFSNAKVGTYIDLILENETVIPCIVADFKDETHTDSTNMLTLHNGCVSEFLVDEESLYSTVKQMGDVSYCKEEWRSPVKIIKVYEKNIFDGE